MNKKDYVSSYPHRLRSFHLFAGAGGGILADAILGHRVVGACEINEYARGILLQRQRDGMLDEFPVWDDICTLDGRPWRGSVDILAGGFPCQDISTQGANHGEKQGLDGDRSGLWSEYKRLIGEMQPGLIFAENSPNIRTKGLVTVIKDLTELGYDARWCKLGGCHLGADHRRERIWILAYPVGNGLEGRNDSYQEGSRDSATGSMEGLCKGQVWDDLPAPDSFGIANGMAGKLDRLQAIGNGQIPDVAAFAFTLLSRGMDKSQLGRGLCQTG